MTIKELLGNLYKKLESEDLDDLVYEVHSTYATSINNAGVDSQLNYLREELGDKAFLDCIKEIVEDR